MKVLNVNSSLDLRRGGGFAERTFQMSRFLAVLGVDCTVLALNVDLTDSRRQAIAPARIVTVPCLWRRFYVPALRWATIRTLVKEADIVHLMGHWGILNAMVYMVVRLERKPYVVCPAGALPLFGRSGWFKRLYNFVVGKSIIRNASGWIAVTKSELPQFEAYGVAAGRVTVIPNGVSANAVNTESALDRWPALKEKKIVLFMGRLNLIKGPDLLLEAYAQVKHELPEYQLVFAGPDGGMLDSLKASVARHQLKDVHFLGHVEGADKEALYKRASLLVVPSRQEAMSIVALEAGIYGTPVLLTDQCGFSDVRLVDARMEVPATVEGIAKGLSNMLDASVLQQIAPKWRRFVECNFSWGVVAPRYVQMYSGILDDLHCIT